MKLFLWVIVPYMIVAFSLTAIVWRYVTNPFGWTSKSSELLEKRMLRWGSLLFHFGIMAVICGHIAGLLVPVSVYDSLGISEETYHIAAVAGGLPVGVITLLGALILLYRRWAVPRIRATSSTGDRIAIAMLTIVLLTGLIATTANAVNHTDFDYRTTINPWLRGLLAFQPDPELMTTVPLGFQIHIMTTFVLYLIFPFTRLVHVFSLPLGYLKRSYVVYRRRGGSVHTKKERRKGAVR